MNLFFKNVVEKSLDLDDLENTIIILPNRRSKIFLKEAIQKKLNKISLSPEIYSIDDFMERVSDRNESERTTLLFHLYESYM